MKVLFCLIFFFGFNKFYSQSDIYLSKVFEKVNEDIYYNKHLVKEDTTISSKFDFSTFNISNDYDKSEKYKISFKDSSIIKISDIENFNNHKYQLFKIKSINELDIYGIDWFNTEVKKYSFFKHGFIIHDKLLNRKFYIIFNDFFDYNFKDISEEIINRTIIIYEIDSNLSPINMSVFSKGCLIGFSLIEKNKNIYFVTKYYQKSNSKYDNFGNIRINNFKYSDLLKYCNKDLYISEADSRNRIVFKQEFINFDLSLN